MPHAKLWLGLDYPGGRRKQLWKVLKCINRCFYWSRATIFHNIFSSGALLLLARCPLALLCRQQWSELIILQHVYNGLMRTALAAGTGTKPMENISFTTATHAQLVNSHFFVQGCAKSLQQCHRLLQGHVDTLGHQGRSEQGEGQHPAMCLDRRGSALEILQCCSSFVLLQHRAPELGARSLLAQPHGLWDPVPHPAHVTLCGCFHSSQIPPQAAAHSKERAPVWELGFWPRGSSSHKGSMSTSYNANLLFKMLHAQRHFYYLLAIDTLPCTGPKPFRRSLLGKTGEKLFPCQLLGWKAARNVAPASVYAHNTLSSVPHQALLEWHFCVQCECTTHGESRGAGWCHCHISLFLLWNGCLLWLLQLLSKILCPVISYGSYKGTLVFCCLSVSQLSHHWPSNYICLVTSSFFLLSHSGYFLFLCSVFPMIWGQQCFAHTVKQEFSAFLIIFRCL